jgi:two-component system, LytTR family, response regulator
MSIFSTKSKLNMLRTIIIDDEEHQRLTIEKMVRLYCRNLTLVAQADSVENGIKVIQKFKPDLVLLDVRLTDGTGFDLLNKLSPVNFKVIFITAFDQYAVRAIRMSAIDYLLKPVDPDELVQAVNKTESIVQHEFMLQLGNLKEQLNQSSESDIKIVIRTFDNIHIVPVQDILYCESDNNYTRFHLMNGNPIMVSATLKEYEDLLGEKGFMRIHKSYLINLRHMRRFEKADGGTVVLEGEAKVPVASRKRDELLEMFDRLTHI